MTVDKGRSVLRQHQPETLLEQPKHVADVAAIFEGGPDGAPGRRPRGTLAHERTTTEDLAPRLDSRPQWVGSSAGVLNCSTRVRMASRSGPGVA